jgi:hypothetical protein
MAWLDGAASCGLLGASLARFEDAAQVTAAGGLLDSTAWIGLTDRYAEGTWLWALSNGEFLAPTFTAWAVDEPAMGGAQDCAFATSAGEWTAASCDAARPVLCRYDY